MSNLFLTELQNFKSTHLADIAKSAQQLFQDALSPATKKAYYNDWHIFEQFCQSHQLTCLPVHKETLILFITDQATHGFALQTLRRRLAAIKFIHNLKGFDIPITDKTISLILKGVARQSAHKPKAQKKPIKVDLLLQMLEKCDLDTLIGKRDRALLLFGFGGAFRRSEICNLMLDDLEETPDGLRVYLRQSKTDQMGEGQVVAMPHGRKLGVISALKDWLSHSRIHDGYVFRSIKRGNHIVNDTLTPLSVALIVKKYIKLCGFDPADYSAHSMRSGFLTEAAENGANIFKMLEVSRHKSTDTLLGYIRKADLFKNHAGQEFL